MLFAKKEKIAEYMVLFPHKQGSYAETYRVKDTAGKTVFLKLICLDKLKHSQMDGYGNIIEMEVAKQLCHHNLCKYIDSGNLIKGGRQYAWFVTEFVSGETLSQKLIRDNNISVYDMKCIAKSVLSALSFLHNRPTPIIHNEISAQNVLLNLTGTMHDLKLIDFGNARFLDQPPIKPNLQELNPFYLAPERLSGICSVQSDLYAVGAMMYQLLYNELPWFIDMPYKDRDEFIDAILAEREKELKLYQTEKFELDEQLLNVISKALSYDSEERFQTAEEFIKAIDGVIKISRQSTKRKVLSEQPAVHNNYPKPARMKGEGFAAIAGMDELKRQMQEEVIKPLRKPDEYQRYGITIPNGMLLYGPPGCGKTFFAKHFAEEVGFNFLCLTPASLKSRFVNATQENIAKMFKEAEENAPSIIFIDEINELVPCRDGATHEMSKSAVNEMLAQMDKTGERGIFIIGATNYPNAIDPAILRSGRLEKKYYIGVPDIEARVELFKLYLAKRPFDFGLNYEELARLTENYVSADIQFIVNNAARSALLIHSRITMELLRKAIADIQPSLNAKELNKYERIRAEMTGETKETRNNRPRIGFNT